MSDSIVTGSLRVYESKPVANEKSDGLFVQAISLKGSVRLKGTSEDVHDELIDIKVTLSGIAQKQLLMDTGLTHAGMEIGAVKEFSLFDVQTTLDSFRADDPCTIREHNVNQELWLDGLGDIRTRNEIRARYYDLEEDGLMEDTSFMQFLESQISVDDLYEESPETIQAIQMFKHGFDFWGQRLQIYTAEAQE